MPTKIRTLFLELFAALPQLDLPNSLSRGSPNNVPPYSRVLRKVRLGNIAKEQSLSDVTAVLRLGVETEVIDMHRQCRITLVNKILAHERFIVFLT